MRFEKKLNFYEEADANNFGLNALGVININGTGLNSRGLTYSYTF